MGLILNKRSSECCKTCKLIENEITPLFIYKSFLFSPFQPIPIRTNLLHHVMDLIKLMVTLWLNSDLFIFSCRMPGDGSLWRWQYLQNFMQIILNWIKFNYTFKLIKYFLNFFIFSLSLFCQAVNSVHSRPESKNYLSWLKNTKTSFTRLNRTCWVEICERDAFKMRSAANFAKCLLSLISLVLFLLHQTG